MDTMSIFALRDVMDFPLLERRISVHARGALPPLKTAMADWFLVPTSNFGRPTWIACCLLLLQTRSTGTSCVHALSVSFQQKIVTRKVQPEVARRDGVLGVNKRRIGAKFDDAGRMWVFGLLGSRSPHVGATDINMIGEIDLSGIHGLRHLHRVSSVYQDRPKGRPRAAHLNA